MSNAVALQEGNGFTPRSRASEREVVPAVDVFENGDEILVVADIPGLPGEAIDVRVEGSTLTVEGKRQPTEQSSLAFVREYDDVSFSRTFRIPAGIDTAAIRADTKQGTVFIRLPKLAASKPRKIAVRSD
ncbi:MAG: Hsp20/alpha crystallin family protein [Polyangiaceae bacterium]|jgi:HSP20 family protein